MSIIVMDVGGGGGENIYLLAERLAVLPTELSTGGANLEICKMRIAHTRTKTTYESVDAFVLRL